MKILKLEAENVKRLEAVTIEPNGNMIVIGGPNGAGKSSALDCIEYALGGKKHLPDVPLHRGAEKGYIILETGTYTVKRTFTDKDSYIEVKTKEGYTVGTPQELLNALVGDLSFDPLEFTRLDPKKQAQVLMRLLGLDFSELDAKYAEIESNRRDIGRDGKSAKALLESIPADPEAPTVELVVSELVIERDEARAVNSGNADIRQSVVRIQTEVAQAEEEIALRERQVAELREELSLCRDALVEAEKKAEDLHDVDTEPISEQIRNAEDINKRVRDAKARSNHQTAFDALKLQYEGMTAELEGITKAKATQIAEAKFPVPGVSFSSDGILVNDLPFEQASSAEQLRIAVAMGLSSNPELKIVLIRDGSLLDEESMRLMAEMADQYEAQVWMERVSDGAEVSVVIKDGRVFEDRMKQEGTNGNG